MTSTTEKYGSSECSTNEFKFEMFEKVCEHVSQNAYLNYVDRLQVLFLPTCTNDYNCKHVSKKKLQTNCDKIQQLSPGASNIINTDVNGNMWHVALENIFLCITPKQYLTAKILSDIVEIMLNAHDHENSEYTIAHLINRCEQTLAFHFRMHPPCFNHENILNVYQEFLMGEKNKTEKQYSNRHEYECKKGIIKFCFNRLDYEVSSESKDGPLINKDEVTPQELKGTRIKHFENEHLILYELLERSDRIKRLMAVLSSIIELLQFNLLIFKSRQTRKNTLMKELFLKEGMTNANIITKLHKQIIKNFAYFIHLDYPEEHIETMTIWLNTVVEFGYYSNDSRSDYPSVTAITRLFAIEFYKIISVLPHKSILKILERIKPNYMKFRVGLEYIKSILKVNEDNLTKIILHFFTNSLWNNFPRGDYDENLLKISDITYVPPDNIIHHLSEICKNAPKIETNKTIPMYQKFHSYNYNKITRNVVISAIHTILDAYMEAYNFKKVHEILKQNNNSTEKTEIHFKKSDHYFITNETVKAYERIYKFLEELSLVLKNLHHDNNLPKEIQVFENIFWLKLVQK